MPKAKPKAKKPADEPQSVEQNKETLLERANPGAIGQRREAAGRLYDVSEFAAEVALAAVEPVPGNNTRYVGDVSDFGA